MKEFKIKLLNVMPLTLYLYIKRLKFHIRQQSEFDLLQAKRKFVTTTDRSFKPFDDTKSIFVHIPKCAGMSIKKVLYGNRAGGHTTLSSYANVFSPSEMSHYFKFTVVRNPWDRLVSAYHFLKVGGMNEYDATWAQENLAEYTSFRDFVMTWLNKENIMKIYHFQPQSHFITDKHQALSVDFIAFLENIDKDFEYISKKVNPSAIMQVKNKSDHKDYKDYYDAEMILKVADIYAEDIQLLGYNFDNSSLSSQIKDRNDSAT